MKKVPLYKRALSTVLVVAMLFSVLVPVVSAEETKAAGQQVEELQLTPIDASTLESRKLDKAPDDTLEKDDHKLTDVVRVSIELEKDSTIGAGYKIEGIADNAKAKAYRESLKADQAAMTAKIEAAIGGKLDVKWNLTLAANIISANVKYGDIAKIEAISGVKSVFLENRYEPQEDLGEITIDDSKIIEGKEGAFDKKPVERDAAGRSDGPNNGPSSYMIGSNVAWSLDYTGAGSKVAVIDTGIDKDHQSFSGEGLEYALAKNAEEKGISYEEYVASLDLLTADKIDALKDQLNANISSGAQAYVSTKIGYGYNYVDKNFDIVHINDTQGEHGSHVEGISAANRFIKVDDEYKPALEAVGTQGVAPDAQIVTMKVFGTGGGAYDSDYMVAIEDAIILGCDSANLSLGSGQVGMGFSDEYEDYMNELVENGMVCSFSAGNSGMWYDAPNGTFVGSDGEEKSMYPYLYIDDNNFATGGSPGSFTNSLTVASVNNVGQTGMPLLFGDRHVFYTETSGYGNNLMATLANEEGYEYVLIDGVGLDIDPANPNVDANDNIGKTGDQFWALGSEVLSGKIALCYRGTSSFFAKANAAMKQGAIGLIVINNQGGTISMNLTGYSYTAPVVSILKADGDAIKADSTPVTDPETGDVLYYTGSMGISSELEVYVPDEITDVLTVSDFSSYGVPGTLVMKPELLAPGGNIYSVAGLNKGDGGVMSGGHDQYELMSGTSMAAPQVNGMAGVMGQYIRENDLTTKTGLTARQLTNSLLMSTAHPVFEDYGEYGSGYWPVIRVGAGLANVGDAVNAKSYILMDEDSTLFPNTAKDGKVKAELGDDPDREGAYEFKFTVYPLEESKTFTLQTDVFTQDIAGNAGYGTLVDSWTVDLNEQCEYYLGASGYEVYYEIGEDLYENGDEVTITAPTDITVYVYLTDEEKFILDYFYSGGAYIQGYTYLNPAVDDEGVIEDVTHSIPILAYYGSWTDASMFDRDSVIDNAYGTGKPPYVGNSRTNYLSLKDSSGATSIYMGNPYMIEETFPAERLAMSSETTLYQANYLPIRNIGTLGAAVSDAEGKVLWNSSLQTDKYSAFYYVNGGTWQYTSPSNFTINKQIGSLGVEEDDVITVGFYALPEYYAITNAKANGEVAESGNLDAAGFKSVLESGTVGDGAAIKYTVTVDDTAPVVEGALHDLITGGMTIKASDNNYIAYMAILNKSGSKVFAECVPEQSGPNETVSVPMDLGDQVLPDTVVLLVADYAGNETAYEIDLGGGGTDLGGTTLVFTASSAQPGSGPRALELDVENLWYNYSASPVEFEGISVFGAVPAAVRAAEYVDGYIFMAATDGWIYAAPLNALDEAEAVGQYEGTIYDMAFNYADKQLYALGEGNKLYTVDLISGELTLVATMSITNPSSSSTNLVGLAIDGEGSFYGASNGGTSAARLYTWTLDDIVVPERDVNLDGECDDADVQAILDKVSGKLADADPFDAAVADVDGDKKITSKDAYLLLTAGDIAALAPVSSNALGVYFMGKGGSLAWDHNTDALYLAANWNDTQDYDHYLWVVDTETGKAAKANSANGSYSARIYASVSGLIFVPGKSTMIHPTDEATKLTVEPEELNLLKGQVVECSAKVLPWTLTDKAVTWTSGDEAVASVTDAGIVTAVDVGETVITVTTSAEPHLTAEIPVTVSVPPEVQLRGIVWDESGKGNAAAFSSNAPSEWTSEAVVGQLRWGALVDDTLYGSTEDTMFAVDADTYEITQLGGIVSMWIPSDADSIPADLPEAWGITGRVVGLCNNGTYFEVLDPEAGNLNYWDLSSAFSADPMAVITYIGRVDYTDEDGDAHPNAAQYYMITESGELWAFYLDLEGYLIREDLGPTGLDLTGASDVTNEVWASMIYDEEAEFLYLSCFGGSDDYAYLYAIDANDPARQGITGDFNKSVWPVVGLYEYTPATDLVLKVSPDEITLYETETAQLKIKVKLGETNEYTVASSDENVVTVDETGLVTAVAAGEATITVTTVDTNDAGETISKEIPVTVKALLHPEVQLAAQITDADGANFSILDLETLTATPVIEAPYDVISGALTGDIYMAGAASSITALSAEDFTTPAEYEFDSYYSQYPAQDIASYPYFLNEDGDYDKHKALFTTDIGWLVTPDYSGWNLSSYLPDMAGLCFAGLSTAEDEDTEEEYYVYIYYLLTTSGNLYEIDINYAAGILDGIYGPIELGVTLEDQSDASLAYVEDLEYDEETGEYSGNAGIVIADNGSKKIYFYDFMTGEFGLCGTLDATNVSGLMGDFDGVVAVDDEPEPFVPEPEPTDPGVYNDPNPEIVGVKQAFFFETDPAEEGWTFYNRDGDKFNWIWTPDSDFASLEAYEGEGMLISQSYDNDSRKALTPDNFAITPALDLSAYEDANIALYAKGQDASYAGEVFAFYAGTTASTSEMIKISPDFTATGEWTKYTASLKDFAGQSEVYVAIRHYNVSDMYVLDVDKVMLLTADGEPEPEPPTFESVVKFTFDSDPAENGWTFVDADEDGNNWNYDTSTTDADNGAGCIASASYSGGALSPDNWAVSPALDLTGVTGASLSIYAVNVLSSYPDTIALYAGTSADVSQMTQIKADFEPTGSWKQYTAELPEALQGQSAVYVAIRHYNCTDMYRVCVDNVEILKSQAEEGDGARKIVASKTPVATLKAFVTPAKLGDGTGFAAIAARADGSTKIAKTKLGQTAPAARQAAAEGSAAGGEVTVTLSEDKASTNGLLVATYDAEKLTFVSASSELAFYSANPAEGKVFFAYANAEEIAAETALGELKFSYEGEYVETEIKVETYERGEDLTVREDPAIVEIKQEDGEHDWVEDTEARVEPTCTEEGIATFVCSKCGETKTEPIEKLPHTPEEIPAVAPTCTETGWTAGSKCSVCGEILTAPESVDALGHTWDEGVVTTAPTCEDAGIKTFTCSVCGETRTEAVDATGHTPEDVAEVPATCTETGLTAGKKCSVCGAILEGIEQILPTGHTVVIDDAVAPTCTETGLTAGAHCSVCNEVIIAQETVAAAGHKAEEIPAVEPTCTETGLTAGSKCSVCGEILTAQETVPAKGHTPEDVAAVPATCTEPGTAAGKICSVCGEKLEGFETIPELGHTVVVDDAVPATCTEDGKTAGAHCSVCNEVLVAQEVVKAAGHVAVADPAVAATCTETGLTAGSHCSVCGEILAAQETIEALGHRWDNGATTTAATCTDAGVTTFTCRRCGETRTEAIDAKGHTPVDVAAVAATCTKAGTTAGKKCSVCDAILEGIEPVAPTGHKVVLSDPVPATCLQSGKTAGVECSVCGEELLAPTTVPALGHKWSDGLLTKAPTAAATGEMTYVCTQCGEIKVEIVEKLKGGDLDLAIATAEAIDPETLTDESKADLADAIAAAKEALKYATTQEALDEAKDALAEVLQNLETKPWLFDDVQDKSEYFFDPVYWAYYHDPQITKGTDETHFSPNEGVTRGQAVTFLWRANGEPKAENPTNPFVDVTAEDYYYEAVLWAVEKGITNGTDETHFSPEDTCQREHIITFVWRFWDKPAASATENPFKDVSESDYYYTAALWAVENGVADEATGTTATHFGGSNTCTRGQCVTYLYRSSPENAPE